ncbi:MAG: ATP synthase F1 subunit gamma, partial [Cyclobacteriaceae bacterium]|nr:ATP synthase F1 subunit gamma [Cyclobacteriaceae bacterium]
MPSLKEVKNRISSVVSTQQITKAMKMVAAAKLRRSQDRIMQMRPFAKELGHIFQNLSSAQSDNSSDNWFSQAREEKKILIVAISSDRGLCGSFNTNVFKGVIKLIQDKYNNQFKQGNVTIMPIGRRADDYFVKRKYPVVKQFAGIISHISFDSVSEAAQYIMDSYKGGKYDKVEIVYNEFKNIATQILRTEQFLPVVLPEGDAKSSGTDYIYQPNRDEIVSGLIPKSLKVHLFKAVLESNASENGARMTAMDKATENAGELLKELRLTYNRTRQA